MAITLKRIYEDCVENLLDQYLKQLELYEIKFLKANHALPHHDFIIRHDNDPVIGELLDIIQQVYDLNAPIALVVTDTSAPSDTMH